MNVLNNILFVVFPYVAIVVFVVGTGLPVPLVAASRSRRCPRSSSRARQLFWGSVPVPHRAARLVLRPPPRLSAPAGDPGLEPGSRPAARARGVRRSCSGSRVLFGLVALMYRRFTNPRVRAVTTRMDIVIELLLLAQVVLGPVGRARLPVGRPGSRPTSHPTCGRSCSWQSRRRRAVFALPWVIKLHIVGAFAIMFMIPLHAPGARLRGPAPLHRTALPAGDLELGPQDP